MTLSSIQERRRDAIVERAGTAESVDEVFRDASELVAKLYAERYAPTHLDPSNIEAIVD